MEPHMISYIMTYYDMMIIIFPGAINSLNFWRTTWSLIWYHIMTYHDLFWRRTWLHDMTLHPASPSWLRFPTWCNIEAACSEMFWDAVRHCEMWCDFCVVLVASCGVLRCCVVLWVWSSNNYTVHSCTFIYNVTNPDRLLEPFSGSEVQWCAWWSCGYLESSSLELGK